MATKTTTTTTTTLLPIFTNALLVDLHCKAILPGSTLGIVTLDNSPFVLGGAEGLRSKLSGKALD